MRQNIVICFGCGKTLSKNNNGCSYCDMEYESGIEEAPNRIPSIEEFVDIFKKGHLLNGVSIKFIKRVAQWGWEYGVYV